ncbi:MAG: glycosyltransferase [Planctomycetota bacterium]
MTEHAASINGDRIADTLVIVLPVGDTLAIRDANGTLDRDWSAYEHLGPRFGRVLLVTQGGADERAIANRLPVVPEVVCNDMGLTTSDFFADATERISGLLVRDSTAIVKAERIVGCRLAEPIARRLLEIGVDTRVIARAGHVWSRRIAREEGADSEGALRAGDDERRLCAIADRVVSPSARILDDLTWRFAIEPGRAVTLPECIRMGAPVPPEERDNSRIAAYGPLVPSSGFHFLVEAVAGIGELTDTAPELELIGDGPQEAELRAAAELAEIKLTVTPTGTYDEAAERLATAAVLVTTPSTFRDPRNVLEAMVRHTPCLAVGDQTADGLIEHGVTGLRCAEEPRAIAQALFGLLSDQAWAEQMATTAGERVAGACGPQRAAEAEARILIEAFAAARRLAA